MLCLEHFAFTFCQLEYPYILIMATKSGILKTSVAKKVAMALSGFFLMFFLLQHCTINMLSVISPDAFNETSHFMGTNALVQYLLQPVLIFGVVFHLLMGMVLEQKNRASRTVNYAYSKPRCQLILDES